MNLYVESGDITVQNNQQNITYIWKDDRLFGMTGYKFLKSHAQQGLVECVKLRYNGKIKLYYFTTGCQSLKDLLPDMEEDMLLSILAKVLKHILEIRDNGFLMCRNLELSSDKIFVEKGAKAVKLIYLPIQLTDRDTVSFERELRGRMTSWLSESAVPELKRQQLRRIFQDEGLSLEQVYRHVCKEGAAACCAGQPKLVITAMDAVPPVRLVIRKKEYTIGKYQAAVDGAITFNKAISRVHCKIVYGEDGYQVKELGSANGTFVNGVRLESDEQRPLRDGDCLRLANSDFKVEVKEW